MYDRSDTDFQQSIVDNELGVMTARSFKQMNFDVLFGVKNKIGSNTI